jgi:16S rRNA (cytidine1402-2'-O)-methyltransferase
MKLLTAPMPGTLFVVATPIGNLDDITLRALRVLREVAFIAAEDTRRTAHLLTRHGITTRTTSLHEHNEREKTPALIARLQAGDDVALVSDAGTPTISDPGASLVRAAADAGIRVEPVPGPNAAIATLAASGLPTDKFAFLGFPPTRSKDRKKWFDTLRRVRGIAIFYEAPHRIARTLADVAEAIGDRPAVIARELTKSHEELVRGPISSILTGVSSMKGEFTVAVDVGEIEVDGIEIGHITELNDLSGRQAVAAIAERFHISANELYRAIIKLKNIGQKTDLADR